MLSHEARNRNDKPVLAQTIRVARSWRDTIRSTSRFSCRKHQSAYDIRAAIFRFWKPSYVAIFNRANAVIINLAKGIANSCHPDTVILLSAVKRYRVGCVIV